MQIKKIIAFGSLLLSFEIQAQQAKPQDTEIWEPQPMIVQGIEKPNEIPKDAQILLSKEGIVAFNGGSGSTMPWTVSKGILTVLPKSGNIYSKENFGSCHLHIEWRSPAVVKGEGQGRGNSGVFLMDRYEIQILDNFQNKTYSNGQAGSVYKQHIPLANACKKPGEWQSYDIIFSAPIFKSDSTLEKPAFVTVVHNGIVVQNNTEIKGTTVYIGSPTYTFHEKAPIRLQDHGDLVSFRNIWIRPL